MTEASESMKERIRKLLAKADNTAVTVEEAKAFNDKAFELMAKYNLDRAMLVTEEKTSRTHKELQVVVRPWSASILHAVAELYICKWFYVRHGRMDTITLVGEETTVTVAHAIAVMILRAVQQEARRTGGGRSFMTGAAIAIRNRVRDLVLENKKTMDRVNAAGQMNALVVVDDAENTEYIERLVGKVKVKKGGKAKVNDAAALAAGHAFGQSLPLRQGQLR